MIIKIYLLKLMNKYEFKKKINSGVKNLNGTKKYETLEIKNSDIKNGKINNDK